MVIQWHVLSRRKDIGAVMAVTLPCIKLSYCWICPEGHLVGSPQVGSTLRLEAEYGPFSVTNAHVAGERQWAQVAQWEL